MGHHSSQVFDRASDIGERSVRGIRINKLARDNIQTQGRGRAGSKRDTDRLSEEGTSLEPALPLLELENTYHLTPDTVFRPGHVGSIIHGVLKENLEGQVYDRQVMASRCLMLSDVIKEKVCQLEMNRFKIIALVLIGQNRDQALQVSSRSLWNDSFDNFASSSYTSNDIAAVGLVFAVYQE